MRKLAEDSPIPLYRQIASDLRDAIEGGIYRVGMKIPTEPELSQLYEVSRITVRKAIALLVQEGLLVKRQGKGTYVQHGAPSLTVRDDRSRRVSGFSESCRENGLVPGARVLRCEVVSMPEAERPFFGACGCEGVIAIDRIRTADGQPIMVEYNLFPHQGLGFLTELPLADASLFDIIAQRTGRRAHRNSSQTLGIRLADEHLGNLLHVPVGEPLFYLEGRYRDQNGAPLYYGQQYIIGSKYTFSM